jgi:polyamine oxidase
MFLQEARQVFGEYLDDPRLQLGTTVLAVDYSGDSIVVVTDKGNFSAPHVVSTFSVGVLQHQDVRFVPRLPDWKKEAIFTFAMATYQKIFLLFEEQFWGGSQVGQGHFPLLLTWSSSRCTPTGSSAAVMPCGRT